MVRVASLHRRESKTFTVIRQCESKHCHKTCICAVTCLRLVEDSEGLRLSLRGVQGVAAGVANRELVITQEDDAGTGFRLERVTGSK